MCMPCDGINFNTTECCSCHGASNVSLLFLLNCVQVFIGNNLKRTVGVLHYDLNIILTGLEEKDFSGGRIRITVSFIKWPTYIAERQLIPHR